MRYDEFKEKVEALSSKYEVKDREDMSGRFVRVIYDGVVVLNIYKNAQFKMTNVGLTESFRFIHNLYMLAAELAMTPIEDREDEKIYAFPIWNGHIMPWYLNEQMDTTPNVHDALKLTQCGIDDRNPEFTFDLNDIKQEVTDD